MPRGESGDITQQSNTVYAVKRRFEVSTCRHVSPPTTIAPTSKLIKTEPNRPLQQKQSSDDHRRHWRI